MADKSSRRLWAREISPGIDHGEQRVGHPVLGGQPVGEHWFAVPEGLDLTQAAALPMALSTAHWHLARLGLSAGSTILINGAGTTGGYAAVQIALIRGMRVIATAEETYAGQLTYLGAAVTAYGDGLTERIKAVGEGPVDLVFDTAL
ncbi:hypothetical protein [Nonomuraea sp. NPDC049158]|uniref:hypothetical protein n=1 Tax=Nonomuraea sp. NPDC049158 TaxID=3155649 RepID=UPI0033EC9EEC